MLDSVAPYAESDLKSGAFIRRHVIADRCFVAGVAGSNDSAPLITASHADVFHMARRREHPTSRAALTRAHLPCPLGFWSFTERRCDHRDRRPSLPIVFCERAFVRSTPELSRSRETTLGSGHSTRCTTLSVGGGSPPRAFDRCAPPRTMERDGSNPKNASSRLLHYKAAKWPIVPWPTIESSARNPCGADPILPIPCNFLLRKHGTIGSLAAL